MNLENCKVIYPKSAGLFKNQSHPLATFCDGFDSIASLLNCTDVGIERVCYIGSSCMYPDTGCSLMEDSLGRGAVYPANALISYTKLLAWQLCRAISKELNRQYFIAIPSDIFGDTGDSHFIAEVMSKLHIAKLQGAAKVTFPGTGTAIRHPIYKADFESILHSVIHKYESIEPINIATPVSYAKRVSSITQDIKDVVGYKGEIIWDASFSDGQKVKVLNNDKLTEILKPTFTPWVKSLEEMYARLANET